jgi:hypothetical protein
MSSHMCAHGVRPGSFCPACGRLIRASRENLDWSHFAQAPRGHQCPRCDRCRAHLAGKREKV